MSVYSATITPYAGPGLLPSRRALSEADRQAVNAWIRAAGHSDAHFDAVIDFDAILRDPQHLDRLLPAYD